MLAHDGSSTSTPTATATALALAVMLAFAPMGDAKAAVGVCDGMSPLRSIGCQRAVEAEVETKVQQEVLQAKYRLVSVTKEAKPEPTQRAQAAGRRLDPEQEVKALQARVATLEKDQKEASDQTLSNREKKSKELSYSITFACSIIFGYALVDVGIKQPTAAIIQVIVTALIVVLLD